MADYTFSTVKIVAHAMRGEPVNVGVVLYDPAKRLLYRRITDNWAEVRRRAGDESLPDLGPCPGGAPSMPKTAAWTPCRTARFRAASW